MPPADGRRRWWLGTPSSVAGACWRWRCVWRWWALGDPDAGQPHRRAHRSRRRWPAGHPGGAHLVPAGWGSSCGRPGCPRNIPTCPPARGCWPWAGARWPPAGRRRWCRVRLGQRRAAGRGLGWAWSLPIAAYLPHLGLVPLTNPRADRYFYLPLLGWCLAALPRPVAWPAPAAAAAPVAAASRSGPTAPQRGPPGLDHPGGGGRRAGRCARWPRRASGVRADACSPPPLGLAPGIPRAWLGLASAELHAGRTLPALAAAERALALADDAQARETAAA